MKSIFAIAILFVLTLGLSVSLESHAPLNDDHEILVENSFINILAEDIQGMEYQFTNTESDIPIYVVNYDILTGETTIVEQSSVAVLMSDYRQVINEAHYKQVYTNPFHSNDTKWPT